MKRLWMPLVALAVASVCLAGPQVASALHIDILDNNGTITATPEGDFVLFDTSTSSGAHWINTGILARWVADPMPILNQQTILFLEPGGEFVSDVVKTTFEYNSGIHVVYSSIAITSYLDNVMSLASWLQNLPPPSAQVIEDGTPYTFDLAGVPVTFTAPVPEPSILLLLATSLVGLGGVAWRRRKS